MVSVLMSRRVRSLVPSIRTITSCGWSVPLHTQYLSELIGQGVDRPLHGQDQ